MDKQQIKARFFGLYTGAEMQVAIDGEVKTGKSVGLFIKGHNIRVFRAGVGYYNIDDCKLVLRHISSLTDREVATMDVIVMNSDKKSAYHNKIEYLRSINVATHFCGIDPITEGWAILEEKIPANH